MKFKISVVVIQLLLILGVAHFSFYSPIDTYAKTYEELIRERDELRQQLQETRNEKRSLSEQISYYENQIYLSELEIQDTQGQIQSTQSLLSQTNSKIDDLNRKLGVLDETVKKMQEVAEARIRDSYKKSRMPEFSVLVGADSFSGVMKTYQYLKELEEEDARVLSQISQNMENYGAQKSNLEKLKDEKQRLVGELETAKESIEAQQQQLDNAKSEKDYLLGITQGEESRYSQLLAIAEAQIRIMSYSGSDLQFIRYGDFRRGEVVGYVGNTGCSTGPHAHFAYTRYYGSASSWHNNVTDPWPYIQSGALGWPGDPSRFYITAGWYGYPGHTGIDIAANSGEPLRADKDGVAYLKIIPAHAVRSFCPSWAPVNGPQKEIHIIHPDGTGSVYAHISDIAASPR